MFLGNKMCVWFYHCPLFFLCKSTPLDKSGILLVLWGNKNACFLLIASVSLFVSLFILFVSWSFFCKCELFCKYKFFCNCELFCMFGLFCKCELFVSYSFFVASVSSGVKNKYDSFWASVSFLVGFLYFLQMWAIL